MTFVQAAKGEKKMNVIQIDMDKFFRETEGFSEMARKTYFLEKYYEPVYRQTELVLFCPLCGAKMDIKETDDR